MERGAFHTEDKVGLAVAVILHAALVALLLTQGAARELSVFPERMTVSLVSEVGLEAAAPDPVSESRAAIAPTLSPEPAPAPEPVAAPEPRPAATPAPIIPIERANRPPLRSAQPQPQPRPTPRPTSRTTSQARTEPAPPSRERSRPDRTPPRPAASAAPAKPPTRVAERTGGGSRIGEDFLEGKGASTTTTETRVPASAIGASAKASIQQALAREIKPHWTAPQGVDVDQLVTLLDFDLSEDGSLKGRPRLRDQSGITDANRAQAARHAENAIRAVQLAAPFDLPPEYYNAWKSIRGARFDRNTAR